MDISKYGSHATSILLYLLDHQEVPITKFTKGFNISPPTAYRTISKLEADNLILRKEVIKKRRLVKISITEKGRDIALKLRELESIEKKEPDIIPLRQEDYNNFSQNTQNMSVLSHLNVLDDHVALHEENYDHNGHDRVVFVYVKLNGNGVLRLWCEIDNSYGCWHVKYAWTLPDVQAMVQYQIRNGNAKGVD
jgi:DNA-binding MarR family transcriptional regulator